MEGAGTGGYIWLGLGFRFLGSLGGLLSSPRSGCGSFFCLPSGGFFCGSLSGGSFLGGFLGSIGVDLTLHRFQLRPEFFVLCFDPL